MSDTEECVPEPCRCCECQGRKCVVWHPGHSHEYLRSLLAEIQKQVETK